ncbi:hypothetical protein MJ570_06365 [Escherichia coli]|nr:hypothetical protein MJ570_06365 [Escherichia coli]
MRESNLPFLRLMGFCSVWQRIEGRYQSSPYGRAGVILLFAPVLGYIQQYGWRHCLYQRVSRIICSAGGRPAALGGMSDGQHWGMICGAL